MTIELSDEHAAALKAKAAAQGLSLEAQFKKLAEEEAVAWPAPLKFGCGLLADYGPAPSEEEIDENRREMFRDFGENLQMIAGVADTYTALIEKNRLPFSVYEKLGEALAVTDYVIDQAPLTTGIVDAIRRVPRAEVPDMPDRIIAATGIRFSVPVISHDGRIRAS